MNLIPRWALRPTTLLTLAIAPALFAGCAKEAPKKDKDEKKSEKPAATENAIRIKNRSGDPFTFAVQIGATSASAELEHEKDYNLGFKVEQPAPMLLQVNWADGQTTSVTLSTFNPGELRKGSVKIKRHVISEDLGDNKD